MTDRPGSKRYLIGGGAAACAVCCATPVLALLGLAGAGVAATVATLVLAGVVFAVVVAGISISAFIVQRRRRHAAANDPLGESHHDPHSLPDPVRHSGSG